jgi:hypothetical protein
MINFKSSFKIKNPALRGTGGYSCQRNEDQEG